MAEYIEIEYVDKENPLVKEIIDKIKHMPINVEDNENRDNWGVIFSYYLKRNEIEGLILNPVEFKVVADIILDIRNHPEKYFYNPKKGPKKKRRISRNEKA
jgi:hypothetical protein